MITFQLNGVDLTSVTAEQAMLELCKPTETVQILAQYNPTSEYLATYQSINKLVLTQYNPTSEYLSTYQSIHNLLLAQYNPSSEYLLTYQSINNLVLER